MSRTIIGTAPEDQEPNTGLSVFDSGQFTQMWNVADALAQSSLIPATLKGKTSDETKANCLRVVEQASRWGLSPFAVMDSASVVHGKLMWEGKLIAAAIRASLGCRLKYEYEGEGDARKVTVSGVLEGDTLTIEGTVADWKTTGKGSPWDNLANRDQMLAYRGARQWARRHAPEVILGVYAPDEFDQDEMINVTHGRSTVAKREEPVIPGKSAPANETEVVEEEPAPSNATKKEPTGKQEKPRYERNAEFLSVSEKSANGKTWFEVSAVISSKTVTLTTFSKTLAGHLVDLEKGTKIRVVVTPSGKGYALESYELITEEGLV